MRTPQVFKKLSNIRSGKNLLFAGESGSPPTLRSACRNMARKTGDRAPRMALCAVKRLSPEEEDAESLEVEEEQSLGRHINVTSHRD